MAFGPLLPNKLIEHIGYLLIAVVSKKLFLKGRQSVIYSMH